MTNTNKKKSSNGHESSTGGKKRKRASEQFDFKTYVNDLRTELEKVDSGDKNKI